MKRVYFSILLLLATAAAQAGAALDLASQDTAECMHTGHLVDCGYGAANMTAALIAGHGHDPAEGLQDHIIAGRVFQRPAAAKSGDAAMN